MTVFLIILLSAYLIFVILSRVANHNKCTEVAIEIRKIDNVTIVALSCLIYYLVTRLGG